jgi:hypothetical protein
MSANATVITASEPINTRLGPTRSESVPPRNALASAATDWTAAALPARPNGMPRTLWR